MKKKVLSLLLTFSMLTAFMPVICSAQTSGTCGTNITWTLDDEGTLIFSGTGAMENYTTLCLQALLRLNILRFPGVKI